eukprot:scaffold2179_cov165-Amphora_coffeaeformis.AAC.24
MKDLFASSQSLFRNMMCSLTRLNNVNPQILVCTKWLAAYRLVPGAGVVKQAVDVVFPDNAGMKRFETNRWLETVTAAATFQKTVDLIATSGLRGVKEVYLQHLQRHHEGNVRVVVAIAPKK